MKLQRGFRVCADRTGWVKTTARVQWRYGDVKLACPAFVCRRVTPSQFSRRVGSLHAVVRLCATPVRLVRGFVRAAGVQRSVCPRAKSAGGVLLPHLALVRARVDVGRYVREHVFVYGTYVRTDIHVCTCGRQCRSHGRCVGYIGCACRSICIAVFVSVPQSLLHLPLYAVLVYVISPSPRLASFRKEKREI